MDLSPGREDLIVQIDRVVLNSPVFSVGFRVVFANAGEFSPSTFTFASPRFGGSIHAKIKGNILL